MSTRLIKGFDRHLKDVEKREGVTQELISNILSHRDFGGRSTSPFLDYAGEIAQYRALLYAYMCGNNGFEPNET